MIGRPPRSTLPLPAALPISRSPMSAPLSPAAAQAQPAMSPVLVVVLLGLLLGLQPLATDLYLPALPSIQAAFSTQVSQVQDRKSTRLNSSHLVISYAVFCLQ